MRSFRARTSKAPTPLELAKFHAKLACDDTDGTIAIGMAARAKDFEAEHFGRGYAKPLASALLNDNCKGGTALTDEARAMLEGLVSEAE